MQVVGWIIGAILTIFFIWACASVASRKGRSAVLWGILGFFFSILALLLVAILPNKNRV